jgi:cellobiose phosphorylase
MGSQTFWDRATLYAMRGGLAAGAQDRLLPYLSDYSLRRLLGDHVPYAIEAWPEGGQRHLSAESALYCRVFVEGLLGFRPTGLKSFTLKPNLPTGWNRVRLRRFHVAGTVCDIDAFRENGKIGLAVEGNEVTVRLNEADDCFEVLVGTVSRETG